jgi:hypothetical protein
MYANEGIGFDSAPQRVGYYPGTSTRRLYRTGTLEHPRVIAVNARLRDALNKRQKSHAVIEGIADIFRDNVPLFALFVSYDAHQLYGKYEFEKNSSNPAFALFVEVRPRVDPTHMFDITGGGLRTEQRPDSRKLELYAHLTKPTTRLARYPLLLEAVLKQTSEESSDKQEIQTVVILIREFLAKVNLQTGRTENRFNLLQLEQQLLFHPGEQVVSCDKRILQTFSAYLSFATRICG